MLCRNPLKNDGKRLSELKRICNALRASLRGADERHCPYIKRTSGEVKDSPQEKSETLFSHWLTDSNSPGCQSILIKLLWCFKRSIWKVEWHKEIAKLTLWRLFPIRSAQYFIVFGALLLRAKSMRRDERRDELCSARSLAISSNPRCERREWW